MGKGYQYMYFCIRCLKKFWVDKPIPMFQQFCCRWCQDKWMKW